MYLDCISIPGLSLNFIVDSNNSSTSARVVREQLRGVFHIDGISATDLDNFSIAISKDYSRLNHEIEGCYIVHLFYDRIETNGDPIDRFYHILFEDDRLYFRGMD